MPAKKAARQSVKRSMRNRSVRSATRTTLTRVRRTIESGDPVAAESALREATRVLDLAVRKGVLHKNNASRRKSRLAARLNRLGEAASRS